MELSKHKYYPPAVLSGAVYAVFLLYYIYLATVSLSVTDKTVQYAIDYLLFLVGVSFPIMLLAAIFPSLIARLIHPKEKAPILVYLLISLSELIFIFVALLISGIILNAL